MSLKDLSLLGDYIQEYSFRNKENTCKNVYSVTNTQGFIPSQEYFNKEVFSKDLATYKIVKNGMFAYNPSRINVGSIAFLKDVEEVIVSPLYIVFSVSEELDNRYLFYFMHSQLGLQQISSLTTGSVRNTLNFSALKKIRIPLPPLEKQKRVADILDKCLQNLSLYEQLGETLDTLIKSRFVEMFGDPVTNPKNIKTQKGDSIFSISNGKFVAQEKRFRQGIPVYGGNGISWYTDESLYKDDTIVIGRVGFQSGNVRFVRGPLWISDNAMYLSKFDKEKINLVFLHEQMEFIDFKKQQDLGDLKKVTQRPFMEYNYLVPPIELQNEFADFVRQVEATKQSVTQSIETLQTLKASLMQKYFH